MKDWVHCPRCAANLIPGTDSSNPSLHCPNCGFAKWENPLPTTIAVILDGDQVLLTRRALEPRRGTWDAVGGFLTASETAEECVAREGLEELGVKLVVGEFIGSFKSTYGDSGLKTIGFAFACKVPVGATIRLSAENDDYAWFPKQDLPEIAFTDVHAALQAARTSP